MKLLDTEMLFGRTVREYLLLALGVGAIVHDLIYLQNPALNVVGYSIAIAAFAFRFFPARAMGVGWCLTALVMHAACLQYPHVRAMSFQWIVLLPPAMLLLLASGDLVRRYECAPSRISWLPNYWAAVPDNFRRTATWTCYAISAMAAMLLFGYLHSRQVDMPESWAMYVCFGSLAALMLLVAGRSIGFLVACGLGVYTAVAVYPQIGAARSFAGGTWPTEPLSGLFMSTPHYALPLFILGIVTATIAAPYSLRLMNRVVRG